MVTSDIKMQVEGNSPIPAPNEAPREIVVKGRMDSRYRVFEPKVEGLNPAMAMMSQNLSGMNLGIELPEGPVKVGDTWDVTIPKNPFLGEKVQTLKASFAGQKSVDGRSVY